MRRLTPVFILPALLLAASLADRFSSARLPYPESDRVLYEVSSFDRDNRNVGDGFFGGEYLYVENGEYVVFDEAGPGILVNLWMPRDSTGNRVGTLRFFLDGDSVPALSISRTSLFAGNLPLFPYPLTVAEDSGRGGAFSFSPVPFKKRLKIRFSNAPSFYHFLFYRLKEAADCPVFDPAADYGAFADSLRFFPSLASGATETRLFTLLPGAALSLHRRTGAGTLLRLAVSTPERNPEVLNRVTLMAYWDGSPVPQVMAPLGELFGCRSAFAPYTSRFTRLDSTGMELRFPMPVQRSAELYAKNDNTMPVVLTLSVTWDPSAPGDSALPFHAYRHSEPACFVTHHDYPILYTEGRGHFVGSFLYAEGSRQKYFMEGDERFYADGRSFPDLCGTGLEDYLLGGWYFDNKTFSLPLSGCLSNVLGARAEMAYMRFHFSDRIPYLSGFKAGVEKGPAGSWNSGTDYASVAFFYGDSTRWLVWTDTLVMGDTASERRHGLRCGSLLDIRSNYCAYAGDTVNFSPVYCKTFKDSVEFRVRVRPDNRGVVLRAVTDVSRGGQRMAIYARGRYVGDGSVSLENPFHRLYDADFFLPESLTRGRDSLDIKIRLLPDAGSLGFNAIRYEVHCLSRDTAVHPSRRDAAHPWVLQDWGDGTRQTLVWTPLAVEGPLPVVAVYRDTTPAFACGPSTLAGVTQDFSFTDERLMPGRAYYYRFETYGPDGRADVRSDALTARTPGVLFREAEAFAPLLVTASCSVFVHVPFDEDGERPDLPDTLSGRDTLLSNGRTLRIAAHAPGDSAVFALHLSGRDTFGLELQHTLEPAQGFFEVRVNGRSIGFSASGYGESTGVRRARADSFFVLNAGVNRIAVRVSGKETASTGYGAGLDWFRFFTLSELYRYVPDSLKLRLTACFPNPFNPSVTFGFDLAADSRVEASVYDARGVRLRILARSDYHRRAYRLTWDGRDESGRPCPSGVYFLTVRAAGLARSVKAVLLR
ncbi:MAG: DUF2961 domain-containing protein [Fibrobacterota bacterium]